MVMRNTGFDVLNTRQKCIKEPHHTVMSVLSMIHVREIVVVERDTQLSNASDRFNSCPKSLESRVVVLLVVFGNPELIVQSQVFDLSLHALREVVEEVRNVILVLELLVVDLDGV